MPLIQITLAGPVPEPAAIQTLQRETTRLMRDLLHKEAALTVVGISHLPPGAVAAGGEPVAGAAWLRGLITAGTNSAAEKAAFIAAATAMLADVVGASPAPTYVALEELPATDWGYDGRTQAARRLQREQGGAA